MWDSIPVLTISWKIMWKHLKSFQCLCIIIKNKLPVIGFTGEGNGNPLQYSCLENSMDRGAWRATVHGVAKNQAWLSNYHSIGLTSEEPACQWRRHKRCGFDPWVRKIPWRKKWQPTPVFLPGESHGGRSLLGYSPWGHKESDTTKMTAVTAKSHQSCPTLCDPIPGILPPGSSVHGIFQARVLEWGAIAFSAETTKCT